MALQAKRPNASLLEFGSTPERPSDAAILGGLERHEAWAAGALYDAVAYVVGRTLCRVLQRRGDDFEDLARKTFDRIVRTLAERQFWVECSLTVWASVIAVGVAVETLRTRGWELRELDSEAIDGADRESCSRNLVFDRLEARIETVRMQRLLATMKVGIAEIVLSHDAMGCDLADVADVMGLTPSMTRLRLVQGRRDLLRRFKEAQLARQVS